MRAAIAEGAGSSTGLMASPRTINSQNSSSETPKTSGGSSRAGAGQPPAHQPGVQPPAAEPHRDRAGDREVHRDPRPIAPDGGARRRGGQGGRPGWYDTQPTFHQARADAPIPLSAVARRSPPPLASGAAARRGAPFGAGPAATRAAVEHLGYVQIDTINVIERSHHHILWTPHPGVPPRRPAPGAQRREDRSSSTGRTRSPTSRRATSASSCPTCSATARRPGSWFGSRLAGRPAPGRRAGPARRRALDPRHRRRRAGREGPPLGQPQAVEARAAARVLRRRC